MKPNAKTQLFVHHHLGMGDHIICNGAIRTLCKEWMHVVVFAKASNYKRVIRMFSDEPRISVMEIPDVGVLEVAYVDSFLRDRNNPQFIRMGFDVIHRMANLNFDEVFYRCAEVPFKNRWTEFKIIRNQKAEKVALEKLNPSNEPYMFVHDDPSRGYNLSPPNPKGLMVLRNDPSIDIFDMCGVFESASEIHCMESSFKCLVDSIDSVECPLYFHRNVRSQLHIAKTNKNWIVV